MSHRARRSALPRITTGLLFFVLSPTSLGAQDLDAHWEFDLLVKGGFSPAEALEVGKLADLVVLEANPVEDIANAGRIRYVMKNGIIFAGANAARVWPDPKPAGKPYFVRDEQ